MGKQDGGHAHEKGYEGGGEAHDKRGALLSSRPLPLQGQGEAGDKGRKTRDFREGLRRQGEARKENREGLPCCRAEIAGVIEACSLHYPLIGFPWAVRGR